MREKQKVKRIYGVLERQFRNYYKLAARQKGETGTNLLVFLESRLDNLVYRMGFAATRSEARQLVVHKAILLNDSMVNVPSFLVQEGDKISLSEKEKIKKELFKQWTYSPLARLVIGLLSITKIFLELFDAQPTRELLSNEINENYIVELYSR